MIGRLREAWQARSARERGTIAIGVGALIVAALWAYVWVPIEADRARLVRALPTLRAQAEQLVRDSAEVERLRSAARSRGSASAPQRAVEDAMRAGGLGEGYSGVAALGEDRIQVNLGVVPFDALVRVITQLAETHGLAVETIAVKATGESGKVRVETLVLQGPRNG
jgi:type II secretory pathway component PulM